MNPLSIASPHEVRRTVDAMHLHLLIDAFLEAKRRTVGEKTMVGYANDLQPFITWWDCFPDAHQCTLSENVFQDFLRWLQKDYRNNFGKRSTPYTIWRVTIRIRQMLIWAHTKGFVPVAIFDLCPLYHDPGRVKYYPDVSELERLIQATTGETRLRDAALIAFAISTGARRFEIAEAQIEHLAFDTPLENLAADTLHTGYIRLRKVKGDAAGKGYGRISLFGTDAGLLLKCYLRSVRRKTGSIFDLSDNGIRKIVHHTGMRAGLPLIHPHAFRSAFVDHWSDTHRTAGRMADLALKLQIGHAIPKNDVTWQYVDTRNERKVLSWIRQFHTSPLKMMEWSWSDWPVHVP